MNIVRKISACHFMPPTSVSFSGIAVGLALVLAVAGCLPVAPIISNKPAPSVIPYLPEDLPRSNPEVLVFAESNSNSFRSSWPNPGPWAQTGKSKPQLELFLLKVAELEHFGEEVNLEERRGVWWIVGAGYAGDIFRTGTDTRLSVLCIVAPDGRTSRFVVAPTGSYEVDHDVLTKEARDKVVAQLQAADDAASERMLFGPCGVGGFPEWSSGARETAIEFLSRIPYK